MFTFLKRGIIVLFFVCTPVFVFGAHTTGLVPCHGADCRACDFMELGSNIINWLITVMVSIIALVFMAGGFRMVMSGGDTGAVTEAKHMMTNAIVGFIIVLLAWLIIDTVFKMLVRTDATFKFGVWNQIECTAPVFTGGAGTNTGGTQGGIVSSQPGVLGEGEVAHDVALTQLRNSGVVVTSTTGESGVIANCPSGDGCTSLEGIREQTVQQAINIKKACQACTVAVVGATEGGHSDGTLSHASGYKIDIDDNTALDAYFMQNLQANGERGGAYGGARYLDSCGNEYVRESSHWDITVSKGSCAL